MDKHLNILHISTPKSWRGGEQQLFYLFDGLTQKDCSQFLLCRKDGELHKKALLKGWNVRGLTKKTAFDLHFALTIKQFCIKNNIDLIHVHDAHAHTFAFLSASIFGNKTSIIVSRRVDFPIKDTWMSKLKYNHPLIKKILCVSDAIKNITAPDIKNQAVLSTVHSGIDLKKFSLKKEQCHLLRTEYNIASTTFLVGNVAAIAPHKDYFTFAKTVQAFKKMNTGLDVKFLIIGDGPSRQDIETYVEELDLSNDIVFTGFRDDIPKILPELDVFLITSETEGLGTSVIDAFACGVPVVATMAGGIPELVLDEKTGLISAVKDAQNLAQNVHRVLIDQTLRSTLIQGANQRVLDYTKESTAEKTWLAYQSVI